MVQLSWDPTRLEWFPDCDLPDSSLSLASYFHSNSSEINHCEERDCFCWILSHRTSSESCDTCTRITGMEFPADIIKPLLHALARFVYEVREDEDRDACEE